MYNISQVKGHQMCFNSLVYVNLQLSGIHYSGQVNLL